MRRGIECRLVESDPETAETKNGRTGQEKNALNGRITFQNSIYVNDLGLLVAINN